MCIANLNVALQPCSHRWYALLAPCTPSANLSNCPSKLKLQGWETRTETCPWCDSTSTSADASTSLPSPPLNDSTHLLFGSGQGRGDANSNSNSGPSGGLSIAVGRPSMRRSRSSSSDATATADAPPLSLSRSSTRSSSHSRSGDELAEKAETRAERNRMMLRRLNIYLSTNPESIRRRAEEDLKNEGESAGGTGEKGYGAMGKRWRKSVGLGRGLFKS